MKYELDLGILGDSILINFEGKNFSLDKDEAEDLIMILDQIAETKKGTQERIDYEILSILIQNYISNNTDEELLENENYKRALIVKDELRDYLRGNLNDN